MRESRFAARVAAELVRARERHRPIQTMHEGYAVLLEEVDELWAEIKSRHTDPAAVLNELVQVAAMRQRLAEDTKLLT